MGEQHPTTAQANYNLAMLYASQKKYQDAETFLLRSRKILEATLGPQDPHLVLIFEALSDVFEKTDRPREAKEYAARAYKIRRPEHMQKPPPH